MLRSIETYIYVIVVNDFRMKITKNNQYKDHDASVAINGKNEKNAFTFNPFVVEFDSGTNKDGYWGYNQRCYRCRIVLMC